MSGQAAGPLLIGASMTIGEYVLPQLIGEFKARFPAVVPTLFVGNSEAVQERVAERTLDLGFIEGDSHLSSLANEVCCEDELQVVCAPSTSARRARPCALPAALAAAPLHQPRAGLGHARGHRPLPAEGGRRAGLAEHRWSSSAAPRRSRAWSPPGWASPSCRASSSPRNCSSASWCRCRCGRRCCAISRWSMPKERFHSKLVGGFRRLREGPPATMQAAAAPAHLASRRPEGRRGALNDAYGGCSQRRRFSPASLAGRLRRSSRAGSRALPAG